MCGYRGLSRNGTALCIMVEQNKPSASADGLLHGNRDEPMKHGKSISQMMESRKYPGRIIATTLGAGHAV